MTTTPEDEILDDVLETFGSMIVDKTRQAAFEPRTTDAPEVVEYVESAKSKAKQAIKEQLQLAELRGRRDVLSHYFHMAPDEIPDRLAQLDKAIKDLEGES